MFSFPKEAMASKSKKKLFMDIEQIAEKLGVAKLKGVSRSGLKQRGIQNETYGRQSMIYISWGDAGTRKQAESELRLMGWKPDPRYSPGSGTSEVQVSYFKGYHWDE